VARYVLTDQPYVARLVRQNLDENRPSSPRRPPARSRKARPAAAAAGGADPPAPPGDQDAAKLAFAPLDWETDQVGPSLTGSPAHESFDAVIACDCIYNDALVEPLVQTCADACRLRSRDGGQRPPNPCLCIVAQQLRNPDVFEAWLEAFHARFRVWQLPDALLSPGLRVGSGFAVHLGVLRET